MVDPVNNRGYQEYNRINVKVGTNVENGEKFSLNYGQEEESGKKEDGKTKVETDGVIAEFSSQTQTRYGGAGNGKTGTAQTEEYIDFGAAAERARGFIGELVKAFSGFISSIKKPFWIFGIRTVRFRKNMRKTHCPGRKMHCPERKTGRISLMSRTGRRQSTGKTSFLPWKRKAWWSTLRPWNSKSRNRKTGKHRRNSIWKMRS